MCIMTRRSNLKALRFILDKILNDSSYIGLNVSVVHHDGYLMLLKSAPSVANSQTVSPTLKTGSDA